MASILHSHAARDEAARGRPTICETNHRAGASPGRLDDGRWIGSVAFSSTPAGEASAGLCSRDQCAMANGGFPAADLVGRFARK